jgi:hypothetical protein
MQELNLYELPINDGDLNTIVSLLKSEDVFLSADIKTDLKYDLFSYIDNDIESNDKVYAMMDRNLLHRVILLSKGASINVKKSQRKVWEVACASMAFFILGRIMIEPSLSLYEGNFYHVSEDSMDDLYFFRIADNLHPMEYVNIALNRQDSINAYAISEAKNKVKPEVFNNSEFSKKLRDWKIYYLYILKAVSLMKSNNLSNTEKLVNYFNWMHKEVVFSSIAISYATILFSPHRKYKVIKHIFSNDYEKLHNGIKNAVWDLTHLDAWKKKVKMAKDFWILNSMDKLLHIVGSSIFIPDNDEAYHINLKSLFNENFPPDEAKYIINRYNDLNELIKYDNDRETHINKSWEKMPEYILELENELNLKNLF